MTEPLGVDRELLEFHRALVETPSPSHQEGLIADMVQGFLEQRGASVERVGDNVVARAGRGPRLLLCSHLDTVPATPAWTRDPWRVQDEGDRRYGLGSNDAKAAVASMTFAFLEVLSAGGPCEVVLLLVPEEETGGRGAEVAWPHLRNGGYSPDGVVVGEPTGLDVADSQKGLMILELTAHGSGCHAANARAMGAVNPIQILADDLLALREVDLGPAHPTLGPTTLEPTVITAGERRNVVPDRGVLWLDIRTVPGVVHQDIVQSVQRKVRSAVRIHSDRLHPVRCADGAAVVRAAQAARPGVQVYGSRTMSDMVWFREVPVIKCGPGRSERSHTPDEFVLTSEILEGLRFYRDLIKQFAEVGP